MAKELFISTTPHETKVAVVDDEQLSEIYFERENEYTLAGSIYKGRVTRVLPGMQSAFVDIGLERDAFLYVTDFLEEQEDQEDFEQVADRGEPQQRSSQPASAAVQEQKPAGAENGSTQDQQSSDQFERGPRRWRGRRGRRRGRGGFQEQGGQQSGPETTESFEGEESAEGGEQEKVILPGESLSKYRHAEVEAEPANELATAPEAHSSEPIRPSEHVISESHIPEPAPGASISVLPGESISKYRGGDSGQSSAEPQPERQPSRFERFRKRFESRWEKPNRREENQSQKKEESAPAGPPVFALPGESLAKYRGRESSTLEPESAQQHAQLSESAREPQPSQAETLTQHETPEVRTEHHATAANVHYTEPERADSDERVEHALQGQGSRSGEAVSTGEILSPEIQERSEQPSHEFGSGVVEEELIDEEESDVLPIGEHLDEEVYEELEEETLDADNAQQLVEAVREAHVNQRLGLQQGEPSDLEDQPSGEEVESFVSGNGNASPAQIEAADMEDTAYEEQALETSTSEEESVPESAEVEADEGRAELRAPANTAAFQQRTERTERGAPDRFRRGRRGRPMRGRRNIQRESQPTISELLKEGQEILVQIAKEPMAKKGARITSHIALPGRFLVYMPTVNHVGVSRKIGSDEERQRLKRILISEKGSAHGGFIVRTAAAGASEEDLRSDLRFLINLWNDIKSRSENSKAPALIYHDLNLVERILRDQVTSNFTSIWVDNEQEYERIVRFLGRFQPAMVRRAKLYTKDTPLFEQFGIQEEINNALKSKVWLKSGGYIVINQTEALVAIDINTGKYVGKTQRLEDTIVKTNIDAIKEIVRQIRLRDLGGIIVIDFIDMDERKNRQKVMQALEDALKSDRAPSKVLQFNDFGLVAITRKRVKQSLERTLSTACSYCTGTGMIKSVQTVCNEIYVEMRKMSRNLERHDVMLRVNPEVVKALKANSARWLQEMEELTGKTIIVKSDPLLHQEQFDIN
ncbi:MAG TPA: Rne/Rng family ribonuclease [Terriglobales bacterium]|nr:Rne/Rng family ribonuclease [Terriglobales bacterium]